MPEPATRKTRLEKGGQAGADAGENSNPEGILAATWNLANMNYK